MARFKASDFVATKHATAADKAKFAEAFCRFVEGGFKDKALTEGLYRRLSMCFGHIAHFNRVGFYEHFFATTQGKIHFLQQCARWDRFGDPRFTFSDVESKLAAWLVAEGWVDKLEAQRAAEVERQERATLARLQAKYGGAPCTK
jgi:hypothetical protein